MHRASKLPEPSGPTTALIAVPAHRRANSRGKTYVYDLTPRAKAFAARAGVWWSGGCSDEGHEVTIDRDLVAVLNREGSVLKVLD